MDIKLQTTSIKALTIMNFDDALFVQLTLKVPYKSVTSSICQYEGIYIYPTFLHYWMFCNNLDSNNQC